MKKKVLNNSLRQWINESVAHGFCIFLFVNVLFILKWGCKISQRPKHEHVVCYTPISTCSYSTKKFQVWVKILHMNENVVKLCTFSSFMKRYMHWSDSTNGKEDVFCATYSCLYSSQQNNVDGKPFISIMLGLRIFIMCCVWTTWVIL